MRKKVTVWYEIYSRVTNKSPPKTYSTPQLPQCLTQKTLHATNQWPFHAICSPPRAVASNQQVCTLRPTCHTYSAQCMQTRPSFSAQSRLKAQSLTDATKVRLRVTGGRVKFRFDFHPLCVWPKPCVLPACSGHVQCHSVLGDTLVFQFLHAMSTCRPQVVWARSIVVAPRSLAPFAGTTYRNHNTAVW